MKQKIICAILSLCIIGTISLSANAAYTSLTQVSYKKGNNYSTGAPDATKTSSSIYNRMLGKNKTSWTNPKSAVVEKTTHTDMTGLYNISSSGVRVPSMAEQNKVYNVNIQGAATQLGTDKMDFQYDVDAS